MDSLKLCDAVNHLSISSLKDQKEWKLLGSGSDISTNHKLESEHFHKRGNSKFI